MRLNWEGVCQVLRAFLENYVLDIKLTESKH